MRQTININDSWMFQKAGEAPVFLNLPHTWNGKDGQDGNNRYDRCKCSYEKSFTCPNLPAGGRLYLECKGVNSVAEVFLNGEKIAEHKGGYAAFRADLTPYLKPENLLCITADNSPREDVYPQFADFTFYGGIYRDVNLVITEKHHFDMLYYGGPGVQLDARVENGHGIVTAKARHNGEAVRVEILDAFGKTVAQGSDGERIVVSDPHLWNGTKDPYLYTARISLLCAEAVTDEVSLSFGFRSFYVDPDRGFFLNGEHYPLRGVCRHQDRPVIGNAISKSHHDEDMALMQEVGANTIRLAHYQHSDYFYDLCDRAGMVVWAEIPYISQQLPDGNENAIEQMKELIIQTYHHPSICIRGLSNEITMVKGDHASMMECHRQLQALCRQWDPNRLTTLAYYSMTKADHPLASIADMLSHNLYFGWYSPFVSGNGKRLDLFHKKYPQIPQGLSEFGADTLPYLHSEYPVRGDCTEEYSCYFHENLVQTISQRPWLWAVYVWNMFDFAADKRTKGAEPGKNHKGLMTFDRKTRKDAFYLYKACWSAEPVLHICGKSFAERRGRKLKITVYSNAPEVTISQNGAHVQTKTGEHIFKFTLPMKKCNDILVTAGDLQDQVTILQSRRFYFRGKHGSTQNWQDM